jgi:DNA-directed RNA polymerase subunit M/transcription elongation factor TFIIS
LAEEQPDTPIRLRTKRTGGTMRCPECGSEDATNIVIRLQEDDSVQFYACRNCEAKWWERDGDTIDLDEVLHLTAQAERK